MGTGHLYKRGRIWWGWVRDATTGERVSFSTGATDKTAARLILAGRERDSADPDTARKRGATLADAFDLLTEDRDSLVLAGKRSARTVDFYKSHARPWYLFAGRWLSKVAAETKDASFTVKESDTLIAVGGRYALLDVDESFVDTFTKHRRHNGVTEHTIAKDRGTLRTALKLAKRARIWSGDIANMFQRFESGYEPVQHWISREDGAKLLDAVILPHRRAYLSFILATGAELAAVQRAQRTDLTDLPDFVRVRGSKNVHRHRLVPVVTDWQRDLLEYVKANADGSDGLLFSPWANALRSIGQACIRAEVPHVSRHGLRHTFAHWLKQEGVQHQELHVAMGHGSPAMLDRIYGRAEGAELATAMAGSIAERRAALVLVQGGKAKASG